MVDFNCYHTPSSIVIIFPLAIEVAFMGEIKDSFFASSKIQCLLLSCQQLRSQYFERNLHFELWLFQDNKRVFLDQRIGVSVFQIKSPFQRSFDWLLAGLFRLTPD